MKADLGKKLFRGKYMYRLVTRVSPAIVISKDVQAKFEPFLGHRMDLVYNGVSAKKHKPEDAIGLESSVARILLVGRISV